MMKKKAINLYNVLVYDQKGIFYATDKVTKTLIKKAKKLLYKKDIIFANIYNGLENEKFLPEKLHPNTRFVKKKENILGMTLYSFHRPFEALHADIAYISFLARSAVDPKCCLLFVDLFTSRNLYIPSEKKKSYSEKMKLFYKDKKRLSKMMLQTDQEFKQRNIEQLNDRFNVKIYNLKGINFCMNYISRFL